MPRRSRRLTIGGCFFFADPFVHPSETPVFWRRDANPAVLAARAEPLSKTIENIDLTKCPAAIAVHENTPELQHVLLWRDDGCVQIAMEGSSILDGPVGLHWKLSGLSDLQPQLAALHRLAALQRYGRFPKSVTPPVVRLDRLIKTLRVVDADQAQIPMRQIAEALFGTAASNDWRHTSDYLRSQVRRLVKSGRRLVAGGYRQLLRK